MADTSGSKARRPRRSGEGAALLRQLQQRRASVDEKQADRKRREDEALTRFADAAVAIGQAREERSRQVDALVQQVEQVNERMVARVNDLEADQAAALSELAEIGRSAEEIAAIVGLPVKRVRRLIRAAIGRQGNPQEAVEGNEPVTSTTQRRDTPSDAVSGTTRPADPAVAVE
jgi:DNA-directed RNA polymerase specialized sigma24 family protein